MGTMIWVEIVLAVLIMVPLVGIPMWLILHDPTLKRRAVPVSPAAPEVAAPSMAGAVAGMPRADGGGADQP